MRMSMKNEKDLAIAKNTVMFRAYSTGCVHRFISHTFSIFSFLMLSAILLFSSVPEASAANAGYSEYFIPGDEDTMQFVIEEIGNGTQGTTTHSTIGVTSWDGNTVLYYDHWENGYNLDPNNLEATYDEKVILAAKGDSRTFESGNIATPQGAVNPAIQCQVVGTCAYDGRDRIISVGGSATVSRSSWIETNSNFFGPYLAVAWEVYPRSPLLTTYIMPFGEDLAPTLDDFDRVYALIQATEDGTTLSVDYDGTIGADRLCERDGTTELVSYTLSQGEVFLLDNVSACDVSSLNTGTRIDANAPIQVQYIIGDQGSSYEIRGLSAFPRGFWSKEYYAPAPGHTDGGGTDIFLYNPHSAALQVNWETASATGLITIPAKSTVSLSAAAGGVSVPSNSAVYLYATDEFWGISTIDSEGVDYDWGYSLVPVELLTDESYLAWAPGSEPTGTGTSADNSGLFITPAQDAITVFIDTDGDGSADQTYNLDRLQTQYVFDPVDGDMSDAHIWATGPYAAAYGQNPDLAPSGTPAIDVGYTMLPSIETEPVLSIEKMTNPSVLPAAAGSQANYVLTVRSYDYEVDNINVDDFLPAGWRYVSGSTTITRADLSILDSAAADPASARYFDSFPAITYNGNSENSPAGTNWASNWVEENDTGTAQSPTAGDIRVLASNELILGDSNNPGRFIARVADLSSSGNATFSFDYRNTVLSGGSDQLRAYVCENASIGTPVTCNDSGGWTEVFRASGSSPATSYQSVSVDPSSFGVSTDSSTFAIRFETNAVESPEAYYVTNVSLEAAPSWSDTQLGSLAANQLITIEFTAETTQDFNDGDVTRNEAEATGTRIVEGVTQTFTASDFVFNSFGDLQISKTSSVAATEPLSPGDIYTYTVNVTNPAGGATYNNLSIYDSLPPGISYQSNTSQLVINDVAPAVRVTEYYLDTSTFSGTSYDLTLDQNLASDYFVIVQGSAGDGSSNNNRGPDSNYISLTADPAGTGDLVASGAANELTFTRNSSTDDWIGVVTVVEALNNTAGDSFQLHDVQRVVHAGTSTSGTDTSSSAWSNLDQVMLVGGFNGAGCDASSNNNNQNATCHVRIYPSGADTINWTRDSAEDGLSSATSTVMVVEWGSNWNVQSVQVTGNAGGNGADDVSEYNKQVINPISRENTWVWGTGHTSFSGIGEAGEAALITLGDGVNLDPTANSVAVGMEYPDKNIDFQVYALTHPALQVDYRFKTDGDSTNLTVNMPVKSAGSNRMALSYNGMNGEGGAYPRPQLSARYTSNANIQLERRRTGQNFPAWVQGIDFTPVVVDTGIVVSASAGDAPNFVSASDNYDLAPNQVLTLTFDVVVDDPLANGIDAIQNVASLTADELPVPLSDDANNIVNNPGAGSATVGQRVWFDTDGNGVDNVGEPGLANVEVTLRDDFGTPIAVTTTDSNGYYSFTGIPAGSNYYVQVTDGLGAGLTLTTTAGPVSNSTPRFDLTEGQNYTDANLGYEAAAGTATIGDLVWSDADGDGVRDAGEPGLSGVTIELWQDDGDGIFDPGLDTPITTTTSGADGSYIFSGVPATGSEDYFVYVDETQGVTSGYTSTTSTNFLISDVSSGDVQLNADFGFQPSGGGGTTAYTISDRIWFDANADGDDESGGESGLSGVTVNLLNASGVVIATTITDATGAFTFSGVPDGNYTLDVTDTGNVLVDHYGTTASAISGSKAVTVSGASVTGVNFGYNVTRSIGDTVFNDLDGDGIQDAGEPGISGVVVEIDDGSCTPGSTCPVVRTDVNGKYLFSGLSDGSYTVLIDATQSSLSGFSLTTADDGAVGSPHTRDVVLTGGASVLDIDYGYQAGGGSTNSIDGTLWSDANQDGVIDGSEALLENVTVELVNSGGTVIATTTTDASGDYSFTGWPNADYTVRVTDTGSILNGYTQTYEVDAGLCSGSSCNGSSAADTTSGPVSGLNFGYYIEIIPTLVSLTDFQAYQSAEGVVVEWQTGFEQGTAGFWLERKDKEAGKFVRINDELMPSLALQGQLQGGTYQYVDTGAKAGSKYRYRLIEEEVWGTSKTYGPFNVRVTEDRQDNAAVKANNLKRAGKNFKQQARKLQRKIDRKAMKEAQKANRISRRLNRTFDGVTLSVRDAGLTHVDAGQLATEMGLELEEIQKLIAKGGLRLTNRGKTVRWQADNAGLSFYGEAIDSLYTLDNVYQLRVDESRGKRSMMISRKAAPSKRSVDSTSFLHTEVFEKNVFPSLSTIKDPEIDYWYEGFLLAGNSVMYRKSFDLPAYNVIKGSELIIELLGANEKQHKIDVYLNGQILGSGNWSGIGIHTLTLPLSGQLSSSGANSLELVSSGESGGFIYFNHSTVTYERATFALDNQLVFTAQSSSNVRVDGFTVENIHVWDISNPLKPVALSKIKIGSDNYGGYMVRFTAKDRHRYMAVADSSGNTVIAEALQVPAWGSGAEHIVISTEDLASSAQALVDYRNDSGIPSQLVLIEDIYQRYNHGIRNPHAITSFLRKFAKPRGARYIVLAGSTSYDYRDIKGIGDNFVPTLLTPTPYGLISCDSCLGDLDIDNYADFIISRIPATNNEGLLAYIEKLRIYESRNIPSTALMLADKNDPRAGNFKADSEKLIQSFANYFQIKRIYLDEYADSEGAVDINAARNEMFAAIEYGLGHINYLGHGGNSQFSNGLLTSRDVDTLSNGITPILTALTCSVNHIEIPGFTALGEELMMDTDGGVIAVWGPSGLSFNEPAVAMNHRLLENLYQSGQSRFGEAMNSALRETPDVPDYMLRIYNLLGDAAIQVQ